MDPMLTLLGVKMEAVAIVGKSLGQHVDAMWSKLATEIGKTTIGENGLAPQQSMNIPILG